MSYRLTILSGDDYDALGRLEAISREFRVLKRKADQFLRLNPHVYAMQGDYGASLGWSIKSSFKKAGRAIKNAAKKVGKGIAKGAKYIGKKAYSVAKSAAKDVLKQIPGGSAAADIAIDAAESAVRQAGSALKKAVIRNSISKGAKTIDRSKMQQAQGTANFDLNKYDAMTVSNKVPAENAFLPAAAPAAAGLARLLIPIALTGIALLMNRKKGRK